MPKSSNNGAQKELTQAQLRKLESDILATEEKLEALRAKLPQGHRIGRVVENGVVHPAEGTDSAKIWKVCDQLNARGDVEISKVVQRCVKKHINETTARVQFYRWRKFNGMTAEH